jgi:hypothetical protein
MAYLSELHTRDLVDNSPHNSSGCNLHSWSNQSANYGYTWTAWCGSGCTPSTALSLWKSSTGHNNVILNKGMWANYEWQALGASVYGAFAVVWFAKPLDADTVAICQ